MDAVQRRGSAARMNYIKRFVSVLLCLVVCAGLLPPPRAQAAAAGITMAVGGAVAAAPIESVLGAMILAGLGITIKQPPIASGDGYVFGSGAYDVGSLLRSAVWAAGGTVKAWFEQKVAEIRAAGGFIVNQGIMVPVEVAEFARQWAVETYDFSGGSVSVTQQGIFTPSGSVLFTSPSTNVFGWVPVAVLGTVVNSTSLYEFTTTSGVVWGYRFQLSNNKVYANVEKNGEPLSSGLSTVSVPGAVGIFTAHSYSGRFILNFDFYDPATGTMNYALIPSSAGLKYRMDITDYMNTLSGTLTKEPSLDLPREEDLPLVVPDVFIGKVGDIDVPITDTWSKDVVISGEVVEPTAPPVPTTAPGEVTDAMVGDIAISGIATAGQDAGLRSMFITKFPFSIPWDLYNAVQLLAAPPKTPYWEVDFMAPIAHRVGGFAGDTTIVLDFSDYEILGQLCRWVTTIMFVSSLAMGTKRLMWTA